ncbi:MAG: 3-hydroxyacyl-[acyl-carrier-protein] dehydratase FabZ [Rhodobacteraceae bacterium]|nr:MAG: 3-hydroxyacyl-[acyl-carrier-protein] dehydratase FabZ [Paracoccaceae bacterium]
MNNTEKNKKLSEVIDITEIKRLIPHRYPFLFLDYVTSIDLGRSAQGIKNVSINEPFFQGHFPTEPIMPGVLIVESLAQTAAVLVAKTLNSIDSNMLVYFMSMNNTKFRKLVRPGDSLKLLVSVTQSRRNIWKFHGDAFVFDELVAEADFTAMMVEPDLKNVKP